jgi:hypothetical protein
MATNAERQAAFRQRRDARITELEAENERLRNQGGEETLEEATREIARLKAKSAADWQTLKLAQEVIKMLKASNKRLRNGWVAPIKEEEEPESATLVWQVIEGTADGDIHMASHPEHLGSYLCLSAEQGFEASFGLAPARRGRHNKMRPLGRFPTLDEAKAACEEHASEQRV